MSTPSSPSTGNSSASEGEADVTEGSPSSTATLRRLVRRELSTAMRLRTYIGVWFGLAGVFLGIAWYGGGMQAGYVPTIIDLLTPLQLLLPIVAFAFGYRAIFTDKRRGILDVLRTYPLSPWQIVGGVYLGRAIGLVAVLSTALLFLMFPIFVTESYRPVFYATHTGPDSPGLFLRFIVLSIYFTLVMLAVAVAISALVSTTRTAIVMVGMTLFLVLFLADIALVFGLSRKVIGEAALVEWLPLSPLSAYRGLVLETTVSVTDGTGPKTASPLASAVGLAVWGIGSIAVATAAIRQ